MPDPIAFRPTEQANTVINDYMTKHNLPKKSDAVNELIEGRFSLSPISSPQTSTTPTPLTPMNNEDKHKLSLRAAQYIMNLPLDVWSEIKGLAVNEHEAIQWNLKHRQLGNIGKLGSLLTEAQRSTQTNQNGA